MHPIITTAKVMQNFTICISQPIRDQLKLEQGDHVILSLNEKGEVSLTKGVSSLQDLVGLAKDTFKELGGGESFLKKERASWKK